MTIGVNPKMETVILTTGAPFQATFRDKTAFPDGTESRIQFYDSSGSLIARLPGSFEGTDFTFDFPSEIVDVIPHGASFQFSVIYPGEEPVVLSYGTAIRKEPRFGSVPTDLSSIPQLFVDNFQRTVIGPKWLQVLHSTVIHTNPVGTPNGIAMDSTKYTTSAALYYAPLTGDDVTVNVNLYKPNAGKTGIIVCSDSAMTSYLGITIETGVTNALHIVSGTAPATYSVLQSQSVAINTNDNLLVIYNSFSDTLLAYRNNDLSAPVISRSGVPVSHGPGFRYAGLNFITASTGLTGVQPTAWQAQDGVSLS